MKANTKGFTRRASVTAVRGALITLAMVPAAWLPTAWTDDEPTASELTQPKKTVEVGIGAVSKDSFKFGEYNGLEKKGAYAIGNVDLRGGAAYDSDSTQRWRLKGTDLGLETRNLQGEYGEQGRFRLNFGYDELLRNITDTYQTPYLGAGSNNLTLPGNWIAPKVPQVSATGVNFRSLDPVAGTGSTYIGGVLTAPTAAQLTTLGNIRAADLPAFQNVNLSTKRTKYDGGFNYSFSPQWDFQASLRHEHKDGYKPMGVVSSQVSEFSATIPDLVNQDTDQANVSLNYKGAKGFMQAAYYGSLFKNNVPSMTWQDVNDPTKYRTLAPAPTQPLHTVI